jgi:hypothetical protein
MIQTNAAWDLKNAAVGKKPIYVFAIAGEGRVYSTHDLAAEGITGTLPQYRAWLKTPQGATQSIDVVAGSSSIGELQCEVLEQNGEMRELVGRETLDGRTVTLSVGHPGIAYSEFVPLNVYQLFKVIPSRDYTSWLFSSRDRQVGQKKTIWTHPENGGNLSKSNPWVIQGTPGEIVQAVHLFALGRDPGELDLATLAKLDAASENLYKTVRPFCFQLVESFEAKQFLETEVYKCSGLYPVVDNVGRLSLRAFRAPAAGPVAVFTFNADNMTLLPEVDRMPVINEIVFKIDAQESDFGNELVYVEASSISTYGRTARQTIESKGLKTVLGAQWFCEETAARLFRRFAGTPTGLKGGAPVVRIEAFFLTLPVWVGDYVYLSHPLLPDILTGVKGVMNRLMEVIDREPDYAAGKMKYRLLDTGLTRLAAAHEWGPSGRDFVIGSTEVF